MTVNDEEKDMDNTNAKPANEDLNKKKTSFLIQRVLFNLILILIGTIFIAFFLNDIQTKAALNKQKENNNLALNEVSNILNKNKGYSDTLAGTYHEGNWMILNDIDLIFSNGMFEKIYQNNNDVRSEMFASMAENAGVQYLYLLSPDGNIVMSPDAELQGLNPSATTHMTQENLNLILENRTAQVHTPVLVRNQYGTFYFYSQPYTFNNEEYVLAVGVSSWALNESVHNLEDVQAVLSRMGVINDGFLFAIDSNDELFIYYKNGSDFLSGQKVFDSGLTRDILNDGYEGKQTILGETYYCTSKTLGTDMVIVAAASSDVVLSHDRYVLIWSIIAFSVVMLLCLIYTVIVYNDFLRQGIDTDKRLISRKSRDPYYFNRSVFRKVFPLVLLGILGVYGISFYTQTLLEISEGVDKSNVILQEIRGRYEESMSSRDVIETYNESHYLSLARIIKFYVEENPEILNADSNYYYMEYDKNNNREYIMDDEGNPLKSVAKSAILQKLCNENNINAIYMYDENGHTIATSTDNWFFTLSLDEAEQSYQFRQILEGKIDNYTQPLMTNDLGEDTQYFGVAMNYYTRKDNYGNTVYVSKYDFEEACQNEGVSGVRTAGGITKHSSLMQIELGEELISSIMASTSAQAVLSTEMLAGGAIVMFDNSPDHICIYSPIEASIGKPAAELGISAKAFTGNEYFGFIRVRGTSYFMHFSYLDNRFAATALPESSMFTSRSIISAITAGVCMILISILISSATISNNEEDELYKALMNEYGDNDLNSAIFNIILPSGRQASTTKAQIRWDNKRIPWVERSPEMKLGTIVGWILSILIIYLFLSVLHINNKSESDSVIRYIFSGGWDKSPNIFALSASIMVIIATIIIIELIKIPIRLCTSLLGTRGETVGHLLLSVLKYGGTIGALFYCLYLIGIDSVNLLASAGIISLVIGLGAQSLIKDIIAGIFIVFEGEFRVGDIVTINNFRGTVTDIGLRTTKISGGGNIKIFNNSEISGVLNMTKETSVASASVGLEYGQDVNYIEEVMKRELAHLKEDNKKILDGPNLVGITEMAERRYMYTVNARCTEKHVMEISRYLNKELLKICYNNGIKVANQANFVKKENNGKEEPKA